MGKRDRYQAMKDLERSNWREQEAEAGPSVDSGEPKKDGCLMVVLGAFILPLLAVLVKLGV